MSDYRWNLSDYAVGYDAAAEVIHPRYLEIQDAILAALPWPADAQPLVVDLGGGSGRLMARVLERWPHARGIVVDQSEPFLALAERRLSTFGDRGVCVLARLQDDWRSQLPRPAEAIVSMSAIHHLEPAEKQSLYQQAFAALTNGGLFLNGDEVRPEQNDDYRREVETWAAHMRRHMADGSIGESFHPALARWIERNVEDFGGERHSGDDCHETAAVQLDYLRSAGFAAVDCPWQRQLWGILRGVKP
jgi:tRNA (cmo5U34)-methyltransferase